MDKAMGFIFHRWLSHTQVERIHTDQHTQLHTQGGHENGPVLTLTNLGTVTEHLGNNTNWFLLQVNLCSKITSKTKVVYLSLNKTFAQEV